MDFLSLTKLYNESATNASSAFNFIFLVISFIVFVIFIFYLFAESQEADGKDVFASFLIVLLFAFTSLYISFNSKEEVNYRKLTNIKTKEINSSPLTGLDKDLFELCFSELKEKQTTGEEIINGKQLILCFKDNKSRIQELTQHTFITDNIVFSFNEDFALLLKKKFLKTWIKILF